MLCQNCNKNQANIHFTKIVNDDKIELFLCEQCARDNAEIKFSNPFDFNFGGFGGVEKFLSGFMGAGAQPQQLESPKCENCGMVISEFINNGKLGCYNCYEAFYNRVIPVLRKVHGNTDHTGKLPAKSAGVHQRKKRIENLKTKLAVAIQEEKYEDAAKLRDEIKELQNNDR